MWGKGFKLQPWKRMPQRFEGFEGWQTAGLNALTTKGYVQAKGRLQPWNSKGWRPEGLVEAAARDLEGFKSFNRGLACAGKGFEGWQTAPWTP